MTPPLAIVILQYGNWRDTVACLQSLVPAVRAGEARVCLVDNASPDDSAEQVLAWMSGAFATLPAKDGDALASHWWPLRGPGDGASWTVIGRRTTTAARWESPWIFVPSDSNGGFAAGMNMGIRAALSTGSPDAIWLLNNDTVVAPDSVAAIRAAVANAPAEVGQFGTTVRYYDHPALLQSVGWCAWNRWLATSHRLFDGAEHDASVSTPTDGTGYVYGASWVLRSTAIRDVGLLSEDGFLYGEELDWGLRASRQGWTTSLIRHAIIWHREGASIGAGAKTPTMRSELADLSGIAARYRLTRRFFPRQLPAVYCALLGAALNRWRRGDRRRAWLVVRLLLSGGLPVPRPRRTADSPPSGPL